MANKIDPAVLRQRILHALQIRGAMLAKTLGAMLQMDASTLYTLLRSMQEDGLVKMADYDGYRVIVRKIASLSRARTALTAQTLAPSTGESVSTIAERFAQTAEEMGGYLKRASIDVWSNLVEISDPQDMSQSYGDHGSFTTTEEYINKSIRDAEAIIRDGNLLLKHLQMSKDQSSQVQ